MKQQLKIWGTRTFALILIIAAAHKWGTPIYKQYFTPKKTEVYIPTTKAREGKFVVSFQEIGTLEAERSVAVVSDINGKIIRLVEEGKLVRPGDEIAVLDTEELDREVRNQTLEYENRLTEVERVKADAELLKQQNATDLSQAESQLKFDENELELAKQDLEKKKRLLEEKLVTGEQVKQAEGIVRSKQLAVDKQRAQLELKKTEIRSKEKLKEGEVRNAEFRAKMSKAALDLALSRMKNAVITAPSSGLVVLTKTWDGASGRRALKEGDSVHSQQTICQLPDLSSMLVKVQVGEADAPKVRLDMPVIVKLEAIPNREFHGKVRDISSLATETNVWEGGTPGRKNFAVTITLNEHDPRVIKPGMTANVEFLCDVIQKAVYVPIECVIEKGGRTYVYVKEGKKFTRRLVKTGKYNDNNICILKGLQKGEVVALRDPTRDLDLQEAGSGAPGATKEQKKQAPPIPGTGKE